MKLDMQFGEDRRRFAMTMTSDGGEMDADFGEVQVVTGSDLPPYAGSYEITPDFEGKILPTAQKMLTRDLTVHPITVSRTGNASGGTTVYIGGIING